jgi:hypothetical protein
MATLVPGSAAQFPQRGSLLLKKLKLGASSRAGSGVG